MVEKKFNCYKSVVFNVKRLVSTYRHHKNVNFICMKHTFVNTLNEKCVRERKRKKNDKICEYFLFLVIVTAAMECWITITI